MYKTQTLLSVTLRNALLTMPYLILEIWRSATAACLHNKDTLLQNVPPEVARAVEECAQQLPTEEVPRF